MIELFILIYLVVAINLVLCYKVNKYAIQSRRFDRFDRPLHVVSNYIPLMY